MERKVTFVQYGCGKMGKYLMRYGLEKGAELRQEVVEDTAPVIIERDKYGANSVKPGLTGWAQVNGRDKLDIKTKAKYDGEYVEKFGFIMDLKCFLKTIFLVFKRENIIEGNLKINYDENGRESTCLKEKLF